MKTKSESAKAAQDNITFEVFYEPDVYFQRFPDPVHEGWNKMLVREDCIIFADGAVLTSRTDFKGFGQPTFFAEPKHVQQAAQFCKKNLGSHLHSLVMNQDSVYFKKPQFPTVRLDSKEVEQLINEKFEMARWYAKKDQILPPAMFTINF